MELGRRRRGAARGIAELRREIEIQRSLCHPNVVKLFESFEDKRNRELHIIMEMCTGGALVSRMKWVRVRVRVRVSPNLSSLKWVRVRARVRVRVRAA